MKIKVFIGFYRQIKGFKGFHAKHRFLKILKVPLGGLDHYQTTIHHEAKKSLKNRP